MPSPFPGMDPYLEHPARWPDVHNRLIAGLGDVLGPILRPRYYVRIEERTYVSEPDELVFIGRPDLTVRGSSETTRPSDAEAPAPAGALLVAVPVLGEVRETYLEVRSTEAGEVVTVLEILSPKNKRPGDGRRAYEAKRLAVLGTRTNLVEMDLLRGGEPMLVYGDVRPSDYRILVSRGTRRSRSELYLFSLRDPIPRFRLPLRRGDEEPEVDVGGVLGALYDRAGYDLSVDYRQEAVPPLAEGDRAWAKGCSGERPPGG